MHTAECPPDCWCSNASCCSHKQWSPGRQAICYSWCTCKPQGSHAGPTCCLFVGLVYTSGSKREWTRHDYPSFALSNAHTFKADQPTAAWTTVQSAALPCGMLQPDSCQGSTLLPICHNLTTHHQPCWLGVNKSVFWVVVCLDYRDAVSGTEMLCLTQVYFVIIQSCVRQRCNASRRLCLEVVTVIVSRAADFESCWKTFVASVADCYFKADSPDIQPQARCDFVKIVPVITPLSFEWKGVRQNDPRVCHSLLRHRCVLLNLYFQCTREDNWLL